MGWDGYANNTRGHLKKFKAASKRVLDKCGSVDGQLERGILDCSACAFELERATNNSAWDENGWPASKVKRLANAAIWPLDEKVNEEDKWAVESAKEFLNVCAEIGTGIHFTF